jgi:hypothetical protein
MSPFPGRLPWTVIKRWADHHQYSAEQFDFLDTCLAAMDEEYLQHEAAAMKSKQAAQS